MRRFLVGLLATLGTLSLVALLAVGAAIWWWIDDFTAPEPLPERIVLAVDLHGSLDEGSPLDPLAAVFPEDAVLGLIDVVDTLDRGAADGRVRSEERRVGKECVSTCQSRGWPYPYKKQYILTTNQL